MAALLLVTMILLIALVYTVSITCSGKVSNSVAEVIKYLGGLL